MTKLYKVETYLPHEAWDNIINALYELGLGKIGNYDCCLSWYEINSSWKALDGANPYLGKVDEIEFANEYKLEFQCSEPDLELAIHTIKANHPYEEVGINIIPLIQI